MTLADLIAQQLCLTGKLTVPGENGGPPVKVVFQGASNVTANYWTADGKPRKVRRHVIPADPKTPAQLARRAHMAAGVAVWHAMTDAERRAWTPAASARRITAFNAFCSAWLRAYIPQTGTAWDGGASVWDGGASTWDTAPAAGWDGGASVWDGGASTWDTAAAAGWDGGASVWDGGASTWD